METPTDLLTHLIDVFEACEIPYALAGSIGTTAYGEPRSTRDIDVVADIRPEDIERLSTGFPPSDFHFDAVAAKKAVEGRRPFNIIHPGSGLKIDVFVVSDAIERHQIEARRWLPAIGERLASFSPPEDLILKKLQYYASGGSDKHVRDITSMLDVSGPDIDLERVEREADALDLGGLWRELLGRFRANAEESS